MSVATTARRRRGTWVAIVGALIAGSLIAAWVASLVALPDRRPLDPGSTAPDGIRALAAILAEQGVSVVSTSDTAAIVDAGSDATVVLHDDSTLDDETIRAVGGGAADVVLLAPRGRATELLFPGWSAADEPSTARAVAGCPLDAARRAGPVVPGTVLEESTAGRPDEAGEVVACYPVGDAVGLVSRSDGIHRVTVVDGTLFTNSRLAADGNAALAVNLLGGHERVVWHTPSAVGATGGLGPVTPSWVTPAMLLLVTAVVVAAVWRGRRFGPLVIEPLPVTVRGAETSEGRARLYARARDATHALDEIRRGALRRLATRLRLGSTAEAHAIADAVADRLGEHRTSVRGLLVDDTVPDDRALVDAVARIDRLEADVDASLRLPPRG